MISYTVAIITRIIKVKNTVRNSTKSLDLALWLKSSQFTNKVFFDTTYTEYLGNNESTWIKKDNKYTIISDIYMHIVTV